MRARRRRSGAPPRARRRAARPGASSTPPTQAARPRASRAPACRRSASPASRSARGSGWLERKLGLAADSLRSRAGRDRRRRHRDRERRRAPRPVLGAARRRSRASASSWNCEFALPPSARQVDRRHAGLGRPSTPPPSRARVRRADGGRARRPRRRARRWSTRRRRRSSRHRCGAARSRRSPSCGPGDPADAAAVLRAPARARAGFRRGPAAALHGAAGDARAPPRQVAARGRASRPASSRGSTATPAPPSPRRR